MSAEPGLVQRVAALRQRLEEAEPLPPKDGAEEVPDHPIGKLVRHQAELRHRLGEMNTDLNRMLGSPVEPREPNGLPQQLTLRTRRLLLQGRDLLDQLRGLARESLDREAPSEPLAVAYRQTVAMTELALRAVRAFPETANDQLRLCDGLEAALDTIAQRLRALQAGLQRRDQEREQVDRLADLFAALVQGRPVLWKAFQDLAEAIVSESQEGTPLRFCAESPERPERWAAAHCLMTADVMVRVVHRDSEWRGRLPDVALAGLLHDAGMAAMPPDLLRRDQPLTVEGRRQIEAHVGLSAEGVKRLAPEEGWLIDAVRAHHERMDGTGYPNGTLGLGIPRLARLVALCDVYAALRSPRTDRPALSSRAALTETLLEAEKGRLDSGLAECLLELSFYPVGTMVELSDGQIGQVVAVNRVQGDLAALARPVLQILADAEGRALSLPRHLNLAQTEGRHVVRSLSAEDLQDRLWGRVF